MMSKLPPGPPPVKNNPWSLLRYGRAISKDPIAFQRGRFEQFGDTYTATVGAIPTLVTRDPDCIHQVLVSDAQSYQKPERGIGAKQLSRFLGKGLVSSNGDFWKNQRRQIQPAFGAAHLKIYSEAMVRHAQSWVDKRHDGEELDLSAAMMEITLKIVAEVFMGQVVESDSEVAVSMREFRESFGGISALLPRWIPYPPRWREERSLANIRTFIDSFIDDFRARGNESEDTSLLAVLSRALGQEDSMTREQLRDEALTLFFAGHETTSHALSWTLLLLSQHPEKRARLEEEVDRVLGTRPATHEDVPKLEYTSQILRESMRLYPPVFNLVREAKEATHMGEWDVPAGAHILLGLHHVHRDPRLFEDAESFVPERFANGGETRMKPGSYLPFGAGTRACIGKRFALMEATLILATLHQKTRFHLAQSEPPLAAAEITLAPKGGLLMRVEGR